MARRRGHRQRESTHFATTPTFDNLVLSSFPSPSPYVRSRVFGENLAPQSDRRLFHPDDPYHASLLDDGRPAVMMFDAPAEPNRPALAGRLAGANRPASVVRTAHYQYVNPNRVAVCIRRHQRREVLFALAKTGRGGSNRRRRRNENSNVRC